MGSARFGLVLAASAVLAALLLAGPDLLAPPGLGAQVGGPSVVTNSAVPGGPTSLLVPVGPPGRIAYVTPSGSVFVAESDGSKAIAIGQDAATNSDGLAPIAWGPVGDIIAYVRTDGALVFAPANGQGETRVVATDAIVPATGGENLLTFDPTGVAIAYFRATPSGVPQVALVYFDGPTEGTTTALSDPATRVPLEVAFSPLDPFLYLRSADVETGREFTVAAVEPTAGTPVGSPFSVDDPTFSPDGAYIYGVLNKGIDQIVRVDSASGRVDLIREQDRICNPTTSPDAKRLVYGAGPTCSEVWVIDADGQNPKRIVEPMGGAVSFASGNFSWSLDGRTISHAACTASIETATCGGAYLDIKVAGGAVVTRAVAGTVLREIRPLVKAIKVKVEATGPISFNDRLLISQQSGGGLLGLRRGGAADVKAVDERDPRRSFALRLVAGVRSPFVSGTVRVQDPSGFDQTFTVIGSVAVRSFRTVSLRALYVSTSSMPFRSGRFNLTLYR